MAEITESRIQAQMRENMYEYGIDSSEPYAHELAELQLKDLQRKGCTLEGPDCRECSLMGKGCPIIDWEKRHPEFKNDELEHRIEVLEAGGTEEKWQELQKRRQEAAKERSKASDTEKADASRYVLNLYYKSKVDGTESTFLDLVNDILNAETTDEVKELVAKASCL